MARTHAMVRTFSSKALLRNVARCSLASQILGVVYFIGKGMKIDSVRRRFLAPRLRRGPVAIAGAGARVWLHAGWGRPLCCKWRADGQSEGADDGLCSGQTLESVAGVAGIHPVHCRIAEWLTGRPWLPRPGWANPPPAMPRVGWETDAACSLRFAP